MARQNASKRGGRARARVGGPPDLREGGARLLGHGDVLAGEEVVVAVVKIYVFSCDVGSALQKFSRN